MFKSILVPLDGSATSEQALAVARAVARHTGGTLELLYVYQPPLPVLQYQNVPVPDSDLDAEDRASRVTHLRELASVLQAQVDVQATVLDGDDVADSIVERAAGSDLVIMTTHGRRGIRRALLGSVAETVVRRVHVPVLLLRPQAAGAPPLREPPYQHVLLPLDGSPLDTPTLEAALALAAPGCKLTLLHVVVPLTLFTGAPEAGILLEAHEVQRTDAQGYLGGIGESLRARGLDVEARVHEASSPAVAITTTARALGVDLIAMGTRGRGGAERLLLGSVAERVARTSLVPVLLRPPAAA